MRLAAAVILLLATTSPAAAEDTCATDDTSAEALFDAAVCHEQARSIGAAIQHYEMLRRTHAKDALAPKALVAVGRLYAQIAWYREAAEAYEEYAKKYATEPDAFDALSEAVLYRKGLGDHEQAIKDTNDFIKLFGKKDPAAAADAFFSLTSIYDAQGEPDLVVAHLRKYLEKHAAHGGEDRVVIAYAKIGAVLWAGSCSAAASAGSCVAWKRAKPPTCGEPRAILDPIARDAKQVKQAKTALRAAVKAFESSKSSDPAARYHDAQARLLLVEGDYEAVLGMSGPKKGDPKKLAAWYEDAAQAGAKVIAAYEAIIAVGDPATAIAATARMGQIPRHLAQVLTGVPPPAAVKTDEDRAAYCAALGELAAPLDRAARNAFEACVQVSANLDWWSASTDVCERELGAIDPATYPLATEVRPAPATALAITSLEGALPYPDQNQK